MSNKAFGVAATYAAEESPQIKNISFPVDKECIRKFALRDGDKDLISYHIYPLLADWPAGIVPDKVNPRSHGENVLSSPVALGIEQTLIASPEDFYLANRGITILVEKFHYNAQKGIVELTITDDLLHGIADGATTDAVLEKVQSDVKEGLVKTDLQKGRVHLEIIVGLESRERIQPMVLGRNTSQQVKSWSMSDFNGEYDWIRERLSKSLFEDKVGYEENAGKTTSILDILSILTLFHQEYDEKRKAPTVAYSSKGRMDARLKDPELQLGYKVLSPLLLDILSLHDYVYLSFPAAYKKAFGSKARLDKRAGVDEKSHELRLTGEEAKFSIPTGLIFPLLASLRALIGYDSKTKQAYWKVEPKEFFDKHGYDLVETLYGQLDSVDVNPQTAGKKKHIYTALHDRARLLLSDEMNGAIGRSK